MNSGVYPVFVALYSYSSLILLKGSFCLSYKVDLGLYDDSGWEAEGDCPKKLVFCAEGSVKWTISCHIHELKMSQLSVISSPLMWMRPPKREQCLESSRCCHLHQGDCRGAWGGCKKQPSITSATPYVDSVTPNLCCDETKNRGTDTRMTIGNRI